MYRDPLLVECGDCILKTVCSHNIIQRATNHSVPEHINTRFCTFFSMFCFYYYFESLKKHFNLFNHSFSVENRKKNYQVEKHYQIPNESYHKKFRIKSKIFKFVRELKIREIKFKSEIQLYGMNDTTSALKKTRNAFLYGSLLLPIDYALLTV